MAVVRELLSAARSRLVVAPFDGILMEAASRLRAGMDMLVLTDRDGRLAGIVTKTDIIERLASGDALSGATPLSAVARRDVMTCSETSPLREIWSLMQERGVRNVPVVDDNGRPAGLLNARDVLQRLLIEVENEEELLRNYVMGVGYR